LPVIAKKTKPEYPEVARRAHAQGKVLLSAVVGTDGRVSDLRVLKSAYPGWGLEIAALRAVSQWEYQPALKEGHPVAVYLTVGVDFTLDGVAPPPESDPPPPGPYLPGSRGIQDALEELVPKALDLAPGEPPVPESEDRAIRWAFARLIKATRENDVATYASLVHPEYLEAFRSAVLTWASRPEASEMVEQTFGTADPQALEAMTGKDLWMRLGSLALASTLLEASTKADQIYLGVVAEGDDLRHVTQRVRNKDKDEKERFTAVGILTFKRDGTTWKLLPSDLNFWTADWDEGD